MEKKEKKSTGTSITCWKNSSIRALVQRECSAQGLDGWLMSAVWSNRDRALGLSILCEKAQCTFWFLLFRTSQTRFKSRLGTSQCDTNLAHCRCVWYIITQQALIYTSKHSFDFAGQLEQWSINITVLVVVDRPSLPWLGAGERTCLWTTPSQ